MQNSAGIDPEPQSKVRGAESNERRFGQLNREVPKQVKKAVCAAS